MPATYNNWLKKYPENLATDFHQQVQAGLNIPLVTPVPNFVNLINNLQCRPHGNM